MRDKLLVNIGFSMVIIVLALTFCAIVYNANSSQPKTGSVESLAGGYNSTTTNETWPTSATATTTKVLKNGQGILGSITITGTAAAVVNCYDATSTTGTVRYDYSTTSVGSAFTSTTTLARMGLSVAAGTYTFDSVFNKGLLCETSAGLIPNTTFTFK